MKKRRIPYTKEEDKTFHWALSNTVRNERGCRVWTGGVDGAGYASMWYKGGAYRAHRFTHEQIFGPVPEGMFVCHYCDNPLCISPYHTFLGTAKENQRDRIAKYGRRVKEERFRLQSAAKLC